VARTELGRERLQRVFVARHQHQIVAAGGAADRELASDAARSTGDERARTAGGRWAVHRRAG
jgi:hypothetical protein